MPQFRAPPRNRSEWKVGIDGRRTHLAIGFERSSLVGIGAFNGPMRPPDGVAERGFREVFWRMFAVTLHQSARSFPTCLISPTLSYLFA